MGHNCFWICTLYTAILPRGEVLVLSVIGRYFPAYQHQLLSYQIGFLISLLFIELDMPNIYRTTLNKIGVI